MKRIGDFTVDVRFPFVSLTLHYNESTQVELQFSGDKIRDLEYAVQVAKREVERIESFVPDEKASQ